MQMLCGKLPCLVSYQSHLHNVSGKLEWHNLKYRLVRNLRSVPYGRQCPALTRPFLFVTSGAVVTQSTLVEKSLLGQRSPSFVKGTTLIAKYRRLRTSLTRGEVENISKCAAGVQPDSPLTC